MLETVLLILKIIGIVLLCLILTLLLLLSIILFVPIRYRVDSERTADPGIFYINLGVSFFLKSIRAVFRYEGEISYCIKVLFFTIKKKPDDREKKPLKKSLKDRRRDGEKAEDLSAEEREAEAAEEDPEIPNDSEAEYKIESYDPESDQFLEDKKRAEGEMEEGSFTDDDTRRTDTEDEDSEEEGASEEGLAERIGEYLTKLLEFFKDFEEKIKKITQRLKKLLENADYYINFFGKENTREQLNNLLIEGGKLLRHIKPGKMKLILKLGREDSYQLGSLLSLLALVYPIMGESLLVDVSYERDINDYSLFMKGRIRVFTLLLIGYRIYFHKGFRNMLKEFKKEA
ncbi:MAG: hypothetical protein K5931_06360 [Lachnospiraceae bacterium]|nr:hypothetical protein [Lachnospiraceae bacterium]